MAGDKIQVKTADGVADAWLYGKPSSPPVIFYVDAIGVRPAMHEMAERLSGYGHFVVMPNLFYRSGNVAPFSAKTAFADPAERERLGAVVKLVDNAAGMRDTAGWLEAIAMRAGSSAKVGTIGYCMGGRLAYLAAATYPDRVFAAAAFHPGHVVTDAPDSPHLLAKNVKGQLYFGVADNDRTFARDQIPVLEKQLQAAGVRHQVELYEGKAHGFAVNDAPVYDRDAAEKHWERATTLFASALR